MASQFCTVCRRALYSGDFAVGVCRECERLDFQKELAAAKAEIERLNTQNNRRWRKIIDLELEGNSTRDRAAAWKKAAALWRELAWYFLHCLSPFYELPYSIKTATWIKKQIIHPTTEDESENPNQKPALKAHKKREHR